MGMDDSEKPPVCEACGRPVTERSKVNGAWLKSHRGCKDRINLTRYDRGGSKRQMDPEETARFQRFSPTGQMTLRRSKPIRPRIP